MSIHKIKMSKWNNDEIAIANVIAIRLFFNRLLLKNA